VLIAACAVMAVASGWAAATDANAAQRAAAVRETPAITTLVAQLKTEYSQSFPSHNPVGAAHARGMAAALVVLAGSGNGQTPAAARRARAAAVTLTHMLAKTSFALEIWPLPERVTADAARVERELSGRGARLPARLTLAQAEREFSALLDTATADARAHRVAAAAAGLAEAYAIFTTSVAMRVNGVAPELVTATDADLWQGIDAAGHAAAIVRAAARTSNDLQDDEASLGQVSVSRATIVSDAAIILFREGLEAVLILAAITASFTGARRRLRRPVFIGALLGLGASAVTYVLAQAIVDALGDGGQRLQAITGLIAITVLLIVTNWFFHRMYWSEWIARFNRRRRALERVERLGFISGQTLGFVILGLTSVYREGFETVLFLQNLQVSAGTGATLLGVAIGMAATLIVGTVTFALGRKLPYRRMLILTGILIGLVLAVMVGTTINNLQGLGWIPTSPTGFAIDPRLSQWLGLYATWEGIGAQIAALLVVYGSYALARQIQHHRRRQAVAAAPAFARE
jgi:high-affinity iron transporter